MICSFPTDSTGWLEELSQAQPVPEQVFPEGGGEAGELWEGMPLVPQPRQGQQDGGGDPEVETQRPSGHPPQHGQPW